MGFRINRVYTRSGDTGQTGLVGGSRVSKSDARVSAFGEIDELNSVVGVLKELLDSSTETLKPILENIQQELFDLGSELATPKNESYPGMWRAEARHVTRLEQLCDTYGANLPELSSFILPGGSTIAAHLHIARTVARRAERAIVRCREEQGEDSVSAYVIQYINRLSDFFFILARWSLAEQGRSAPLWVQEKARK